MAAPLTHNPDRVQDNSISETGFRACGNSATKTRLAPRRWDSRRIQADGLERTVWTRAENPSPQQAAYKDASRTPEKDCTRNRNRALTLEAWYSFAVPMPYLTTSSYGNHRAILRIFGATDWDVPRYVFYRRAAIKNILFDARTRTKRKRNIRTNTLKFFTLINILFLTK